MLIVEVFLVPSVFPLNLCFKKTSKIL